MLDISKKRRYCDACHKIGQRSCLDRIRKCTISDDASVFCMYCKAVLNVMPDSAHDVDVFLFVLLDGCTGCCLIVTMMVLLMVCLVE